MLDKIAYYRNGFKTCCEKFRKKMTLSDFHAVNFGCFVTGVLFASCLPKMTKKLRGVLALASFFLMLPALIKMIKIIKDVFKYRWDWA